MSYIDMYIHTRVIIFDIMTIVFIVQNYLEVYCIYRCLILRLLSVSIFTFFHFLSRYIDIVFDEKGRERERERIYVRCTLKIFSLLFSSLHFVAFVSILNAVNFFSVSFVRPVKYNLHLMSLQITIRSVQLSVFHIIFLFLSILLERYLLVL
jgi:hypothetical protein